MSSFNDSLLQEIPALRAFARGLLASRKMADDLVGTCLWEATQWPPVAEDGGDLKIWLFGRLYRLFRDGHAGTLDRNAAPEAPAAFEDDDPMDDMAMARVEAALQDLPYEWRAAVILVTMHGFRADQAGRILDVPAVTVRDRARRGQAMLREILYGDLISHTATGLAGKVGNPRSGGNGDAG